VERGKTYLGMYRAIEGLESTRFIAVLQVNMFFSIKRLQDIMPQFLVKWLGKFRELTIQRFSALQKEAESRP